jgi:hypothetical protein
MNADQLQIQKIEKKWKKIQKEINVNYGSILQRSPLCLSEALADLMYVISLKKGKKS